jgi:hypothetical protein
MNPESMSDAMTVKLETDDVSNFDPTAAIDLWTVSMN